VGDRRPAPADITAVEDAQTIAAESAREFRDAHHDGMAALQRGDLEALSDAIADEAAAIDRHAEAAAELTRTVDQRSDAATGGDSNGKPSD
jgi:hypothetical protein